MMMLEANHDGFQKGNIKLQGYFGFLHKEPWFRNNGEVCEKVELHDFKLGACGKLPDLFIYNYINFDSLHCAF
jgi:hypothetical protein